MWKVILCPVVMGVIVVLAHADERKGGDRLVHELMERTHEGRRSPYGHLRRILAGDGAPWPEVERTVQAFEPMCRALLASADADIRDSAGGYVDAVKELAASVKRRDAAGVRAGFESLEQSCSDCHFKGGIGGTLDDEEDDDDDEEENEDREATGRLSSSSQELPAGADTSGSRRPPLGRPGPAAASLRSGRPILARELHP